MVIYQFSNSPQIFFIVIFSIMFLISLIIGIACFPMLKLFFQPENSIKSKIILLFVCIPIYVFCVSLFVLSMTNISNYSSTIKNTDLESCNIIEGKIEEIIKEPQYSRGADLVSYYISFTIDSKIYYIDMDVGIPKENIKYWNVGEIVTVYYQISDNRNMVIRVEQ